VEVSPLLRWAAAVALVSAPSAFSAFAQAQEGPPPTTLPARPITESVDRVIQRLEEEGKDPCLKSIEKGVPCFPVTVNRGPEISVRDSLKDLGPSGKPSPNRPPTKDDMAKLRPGPASTVVPLVTFDPGCLAKSALRRLKGKNDVFYLYRMRDIHGERLALLDRRMDAARFQGELEFLGKFDGECDALAAYRREERKPKPPR